MDRAREKVAQAADALDPEECRERLVDLLLEACLPDDTVSMPAHYAQLIAASEAPVVTEAYRKGREALDAAVNRILVRAGVSLTRHWWVALVDGGSGQGHFRRGTTCARSRACCWIPPSRSASAASSARQEQRLALSYGSNSARLEQHPYFLMTEALAQKGLNPVIDEMTMIFWEIENFLR